MSYPAVGSHGPHVGPDIDGPRGPAWVITACGATVRGWRWYVVHARGGRQVRITFAPYEATEQTVRDGIALRVRSLTRIPSTSY